MKTKKIVISALLLAIGALLHAITPAFMGMQADFSLIMLFIVVYLNKDDYKISLIAGVITGIFAAATTKFPGGQIPNLIDKFITVNIIFIFINLLSRKLNKNIYMAIAFILGTLFSGMTFLISAGVLVGLPSKLTILIASSVLPAVVVNVIFGMIIFKVVEKSLKIYEVRSIKKV